MGTKERSQPASKSSWDSQDFGDINMVFKMAHFRKSTGPRWVTLYSIEQETFPKDKNIIHHAQMRSPSYL